MDMQCFVRPEDRISNEEFRTRLSLENVYKINDSNGLVIQKNERECLFS